MTAADYRAAAARCDRAAITARTPAESRELRDRARELRLKALLTALEITA